MCVKKWWQEGVGTMCVTNGGRSGNYLRYKQRQEWELCELQKVAGMGSMSVTNCASVWNYVFNKWHGSASYACYKVLREVGNMWLTTGGRSGIYIC